jgi:hypothetical protein
VPLQVALRLAAEESRKKGERVADAWEAKRKTASSVPLTKKGPAWLKLTADRKGWVFIPERAELVRKMFALAAEGYGVARISEEMCALCPSGWNGKGWHVWMFFSTPIPAAVVRRVTLAVVPGDLSLATGGMPTPPITSAAGRAPASARQSAGLGPRQQGAQQGRL